MWRTDARGLPGMSLTTSAGDMTYRVEITQRAARDLEYLYQYIHAESSPAAARWYNGLEEAIGTLERFPRRCRIAPEGTKSKRPLRHLLCGCKPHVFRVVYEIDELDGAVRILTIRHGVREEEVASDLPSATDSVRRET
jgi:toxin ParE1/3/4